MRFLFVVRFKTLGNNGANSTKTFRTVAKSPKDAAQHMRKKKGRIISVRKVKKVLA